jgi:hypothetical protein
MKKFFVEVITSKRDVIVPHCSLMMRLIKIINDLSLFYLCLIVNIECLQRLFVAVLKLLKTVFKIVLFVIGILMILSAL